MVKPVTVVDIDRGYKAIVKRVKKFGGGAYVRVGIQGTEAAEDRAFGETNAALAAVHEFGSKDGRIPQRSFMRGTLDRERLLINRMLQRASRRAVVEGDAEKELGIVGERIRAEMIRTIDRSLGLKPLAQSTIDRKGSSKPLDDTGVLKNSITWEVVAE